MTNYNDPEPHIQSPLLVNSETNQHTLSHLKLICLTIGLAGMQFTWAVELSYGTPYLLSLGLSKPIMSLVWLAGPLSGLLVQPLVGILSDHSRSNYGKRRPFIVFGSVLVVLSLLMVAFAGELGRLFGKQFGIENFMTQICAVFGFYVLDFSVNAVQASLRTLILDVVPFEQQNIANAFAGKMIGFGNLSGYFFGALNLMSMFKILFGGRLNYFYNSQFKSLCIVAVVVFILCVFINCYFVEETSSKNNHQTDIEIDIISSRFIFQKLKKTAQFLKSVYNLPYPIQQICNIQFFSWFSWFPFLFYSTTWISEIFSLQNCRDKTVNDGIEVTRVGSFALFLFSLISFIVSTILPAISNQITKEDYMGSNLLKYVFTPKGLYSFSITFLATLFFSTYFVNSVYVSVLLIGLCGISWSIFMWVPFAMIGEFMILFKEKPLLSERIDNLENNEQTNNDAKHFKERFKEIETQFKKFKGGTILGIHNMYVVLPQFLVNFMSFVVFSIILDMQPPESEVPPSSPPNHILDSHLFLLKGTKHGAFGADNCNGYFKYPVGIIFRLSALPLFYALYLSCKLKPPSYYKAQVSQ